MHEITHTHTHTHTLLNHSSISTLKMTSLTNNNNTEKALSDVLLLDERICVCCWTYLLCHTICLFQRCEYV